MEKNILMKMLEEPFRLTDMVDLEVVRHLQGGPLLVLNRVITPINGRK